MELKQLRYFLKIAELGSFTKASTDLGVAQPLLSRQMGLLERELGHHLLLRNGRGVTLSPAGKVLSEHARGILHQVDQATEALGTLRGTPTGKVALGLPTSLALRWAVTIARAFREQMPQVALTIKEGLSDVLLESLANGRLDIALLYNPAPHKDLDFQLLFAEELVLVQNRHPKGKHPTAATQSATLREIAALPLVIPSPPNAIRAQLESALAAQGQRPTIAMEMDGVAAILELVADNAGAAVLSKTTMQSAARPERFVQRAIEGGGLKAQLCLATSQRRPLTLAMKRTVELVQGLTVLPGSNQI
jgi:LysR family nitrogen assimilation transcriptional regulator